MSSYKAAIPVQETMVPKRRPKRMHRFFLEYLGKYFSLLCAVSISCLTLIIILFIAFKGLAIFTGPHHPSLINFLFSSNWQPDAPAADGGPQFGILVFLIGSISVSGLALLFSVPLSLAAAVLIAEINPVLGKRVLRPSLELFSGIPSVVYGWVGLSLLVPFIRNYFDGLGFSLLAGGLVLAIMILPTITTLSTDALQALPVTYKEGSFALGATRWQTIRHVLIPAVKARLGIAITLGLARAFGEALAVQMVIGNSVRIPHSLFESTSTLTSVITMDMGNTVSGSNWNNALWAMALFLLLITFCFILLVKFLGGSESKAA